MNNKIRDQKSCLSPRSFSRRNMIFLAATNLNKNIFICRRKGEIETDSFRNFYEDLGKIEEKKIRLGTQPKVKNRLLDNTDYFHLSRDNFLK